MTVAELRKVLDILPPDAEVRLGLSDDQGRWTEIPCTVYTVREAYTSAKNPECNKPAVIAIG